MKNIENDSAKSDTEKLGSVKNKIWPFAEGVNRRAFLRTSGSLVVAAGISSCKFPFESQKNRSEANLTEAIKTDSISVVDAFTKRQQIVIDILQMHLFPDDGDGPSAHDINALTYLNFAMKDQKNIDDGDPSTIAQGIESLEKLSTKTTGSNFTKLSSNEREGVMTQLAKSRSGENFLSLLIYYLAEALMLDPIYCGNPDMIGWKWLEHQPGFPRPTEGKTFRDFESKG